MNTVFAVVFLFITVIIFWKSTVNILETRKVFFFSPLMFFSINSFFVFSLLINEVFNLLMWNIVQVVAIIISFFVIWSIFREVLING